MDLALAPARRAHRGAQVREGPFEVYAVGPMTLGRATYEPGWRWSEHVGPATGEASCPVEHVGLVVAGAAAVAWTTAPSG